MATKGTYKEEVDLDEVAGTFTIVANGISDLKKADARYLKDTQYSIAAGLGEDGVELDEKGVSYKGNSIMIPSDNEDMRMVQSWAKNQTKLAADTVKMIKPNMDYNDLYEERADHLYVAALLTNTAKPNKAPKYTVKFMKDKVTSKSSSSNIDTDKVADIRKQLGMGEEVVLDEAKKEKDEGNAFGKALMAAKEKGEKTFVVAGKKYDVQEELSLENAQQFKVSSMKQALAKVWGFTEAKSPEQQAAIAISKKEKSKKENAKTDTGGEMAAVEIDPKLKEK